MSLTAVTVRTTGIAVELFPKTEAEEFRTTAIDALELVEVVLGLETPYTVLRVLRDLKRRG